MLMPILFITAVVVSAVLAGTLALYMRRKRRDNKFKKGLDAESVVLHKYIPNFVMEPFFRAFSKKEAIEKLVEMAGGKFPEIVCNVEHAKQAVFNREESMPTGLDNGIAVPHGRTDGVNQITGVLALVDNSENDNGIIPDYDTIDHSKIQILCLTLIPDSISTPYLQLIAAFIRIFQDPDNREELLSCKTSEEMGDFFRSVI
jgi:mannitol/fructose-specific phosphotransferase system IIA component (Ntr-type)